MEENDGVWKCSKCASVFYSKRNLNRHFNRIHEKIVTLKTVICKENECAETFITVKELGEHLEGHHKLKDFTVCENHKFASKLEFKQWLSDEEQASGSKYISTSSAKKLKDYAYSTLGCHRSGSFKPRGVQKQLKAQGSCKIGHHCTSRITLKEYTSHIEMAYYKKHCRHDPQLCHLPIPKEEKQVIAGKLFQGVSESRIVQDLRSSFKPFEVKRTDLITKKDLHNIKSEYGITKSSQGSVFDSDEESVHAWVRSMEGSDSNPVLLYKRQDVEHPSLHKKDFLLGIANPFQRGKLVELGGDRICIDSTHGITSCGFEMVTVLVIDKFNEGMPVAFLITSTVNTYNLIAFFQAIKNSISIDLNPKAFMSDDASMFNTAWQHVFGPCRHLICSWHVDRAWQGHINCIPAQKRVEVYQSLKCLMYELDELQFQKMLDEFLIQLFDDDDTKIFGKYFCDYYAGRAEKWAYCFRKNLRINTNMHIENFHKSLKHIYLEGKKIKRLDKTLSALTTLVGDKKHENIIKQYKGKITKKCTLNFKRHIEAKTLNLNLHTISSTEWQISSSNDEDTYTITKQHDCTNACLVACRVCVICSGAYQCSCHDNAIGNNVCKHIHYMLMKLNGKKIFVGPLNTFSQSTSVASDIQPTQSNQELKMIEFSSFSSKFSSFSSQCDTIPNLDDDIWQQIKLHANAIEHLFTVPRQEQHTTISKQREPVNKRIEKQKRFHTTKKTRVSKKTKLSKPSAPERQIKKSILLNQKLNVSTDIKNDHAYF